METMTSEQFLAQQRKAAKPSKYKNKPTMVGGVTFDSKKEAARYKALIDLVQAGTITNLVLQPAFVLQEAFRDAEGTHHRAIVYIGDFGYTEAGRRVVEDVKSAGTMTDVFRLKEKLFRKRYPDIVFRLVGLKAKKGEQR